MPDILGRNPGTFGGAFSADSAAITFGLGPGVAGGVGLITQKMTFVYSQKITRIYEIGSRAVFFVVGRAEGRAQISRILGPRPTTLAFYAAYGNACRADQNTLIFQAVSGCNVPSDTGAGFVFACVGCLLEQIQFDVSAEQGLVAENLAISFVSMVV